MQGYRERHRGRGCGQEAEDRSKVQVSAMTFIGSSAGKARPGRVNSLGLSSWNNVSELPAIGWPLVA